MINSASISFVVGLAPSRTRKAMPALGEFLADFKAKREGVGASSTGSTVRLAATRLTDYFGADVALDQITPGMADDWLLWMTTKKEYAATMKSFDELIGLNRIRGFHLNDSKKPLGSRVDRHAHIGQGYLGLEPFRLLVNDPRFRRHPMVLETPKESPDGVDLDAMNLTTLRGLVRD